MGDCTFEVFLKYLTKDTVALDVGAEIGLTALYMASKAKYVVAIEPSRNAVKLLKKSLFLNPKLKKKITILEGCLAERDGSYFYGKGSKLFNDIHFINQNCNYSVEGFSISRISKKFGKFDFIKMDIEGGEYYLIPALSKYIKINRPNLLISIHPGFIRGGWKNIFGKVKNIAFRYYDNTKLIFYLRGYSYYYNVEAKSQMHLIQLLSFTYIRGKSGNECQILATNKKWI